MNLTGEPPPTLDAADIAGVMDHPAFQQVIREEIADVLDGPGEALNQLHRRGRDFIGCFFVYRLHRRPEGLTLSTLRAQCAEAGYPAAFGRALFDRLKFLRYVEPVAGGDDRRERRYAPSAAMDEAFREKFRRELATTAMVEPDAARLIARLDEPELFGAYMEAVAVLLLDITPAEGGWTLGPFVDRAGGIGMLYRLLSAATERNDVMPPAGPVRCSVSALSRAGGISRAQAMDVLREAEAAGLLERVSDRAVLLTPTLRETAKVFFAVAYAVHVRLARWALARA